MPRPVFVICSESGAEDKRSGLISLYNLAEKVIVERPPRSGENVQVAGKLRLHAVAYWSQEDGDGDAEFECQIALIPPGGEASIESPLSDFRFKSHVLFFRFIVDFDAIYSLSGAPGLMIVQSRVRKKGTSSEWITQEFPIRLEVIETRPLKVPPTNSDADRSLTDQ